MFARRTIGWESLPGLLAVGNQLTRTELLALLRLLIPALPQFGGEPLLLEIRSAIRDTAAWFP